MYTIVGRWQPAAAGVIWMPLANSSVTDAKAPLGLHGLKPERLGNFLDSAVASRNVWIKVKVSLVYIWNSAPFTEKSYNVEQRTTKVRIMGGKWEPKVYDEMLICMRRSLQCSNFVCNWLWLSCSTDLPQDSNRDENLFELNIEQQFVCRWA